MLEIDFSVSLIGADAFPHLTRLQCRHFDASSSAAFPKLAELLIFGLDNIEKLPNMRLPSLRKLLIGSPPILDEAELVRGFVLANSHNLSFLKMSGISFPSDPAIVFPNLIELALCCQEVDVVGCAFPALTHLTARGNVTAKFLTSLTAEQMLSLEVCDFYEVDNLMPAISRMENLKSLTFKYNGSKHPDGSLSIIFNNMIHLEKVHLCAYPYGSLNEDRGDRDTCESKSKVVVRLLPWDPCDRRCPHVTRSAAASHSCHCLSGR